MDLQKSQQESSQGTTRTLKDNKKEDHSKVFPDDLAINQTINEERPGTVLYESMESIENEEPINLGV